MTGEWLEIVLWCSRIGDQSNATCHLNWNSARDRTNINSSPVLTVLDFPDYSDSLVSWLGDTECSFVGSLRNLRFSKHSAIQYYSSLGLGTSECSFPILNLTCSIAPCSENCRFALGILSNATYCAECNSGSVNRPEIMQCSPSDCTSGFYQDDEDFCSCISPNYIDPSTGNCVSNCPLDGCSVCLGLNKNLTCQTCTENYVYNNLTCCSQNMLFENRACVTTCSEGYQQLGNLCCPHSTFQQSGSCVPNCENGYNLLNNNTCCLANQYYKNGFCVQDCGAGYYLSNQGICIYNQTSITPIPTNVTPVDDDYVPHVNRNYSAATNTTSQALGITKSAISGVYAVAGSAQPSLGATMFLVLLGSDTLMMLKHVNVRYADFNYAVFDSMGENFFPNWFLLLKGDDYDEDEYIINVGSFGYQQKVGLFLEDNGDKIVQFLFFFFIALILNLLRSRMEKAESSFWKMLYDRAMEFFHYNLFLSLIFGSYLELLLGIFLSLQLVPQSFECFFATLSLLLGVATIVGLYLLVNYLFKSLNRIFKEKALQKSYMTKENKILLSKINLIHGEMAVEDKYQYFFFFFILIKQSVFMAVIAYLQIQAIYQIVLLGIITILFIAVILHVRPFSSQETTVVAITNEAIVVMTLVLAGVLSFNDSDEDYRNFIGYGIVALVIICIAFNFLVSLRGMILSIKEIWQKSSVDSNDEKKAKAERLRRMLVAALQTDIEDSNIEENNITREYGNKDFEKSSHKPQPQKHHIEMVHK